MWLLVALVAAAASPAVWWLWSRWSRPPPPVLGGASGSSAAQVAAARREVERSPGNPVAQLQLGRLLMAGGRGDSALPPLRAAAVHPETAGLAAVQLAQAATDPATAAAVLPDARKAVALAPNDPRAWEGLVRINYAAGRTGPAGAVLAEGIRRFPHAARLRFIQAEAAANDGDARTAITAYQAGLKELPDPNATLMLGLIYARTHAAKPARDTFRRAAELDPSSLMAHLGLAQTELDLGLTQEAESTAYTCLQLAPGDPEAILILARVLVQKGDPASERTARELLEHAAKIAPDNMDARYYLGQVKLRAGDAKGAARELEEVVMRSPERQDARESYVRALRQAGDTRNAEVQAKLADQMAKLEQLRVNLRERVAQSPKDPAARCELADFYLAHGAAPMAVRQYQKALEIDPGNRRAAEGLRRAGGAAP